MLLFERSRTGILLTPAGDALRRKAEAQDLLLRDAEQEIEFVRQGFAAPVQVAFGPAIRSPKTPAGYLDHFDIIRLVAFVDCAQFRKLG